jgi:hypothetical protein
MAKHRELITGNCEQLLYGPKGGIEGALIKVKGNVVQISMPADVGAGVARTFGPGKRLRVLAVADHSPKTVDAAHPVFQFHSLADASGSALEMEGDDPKHTSVKGIVAALHFARHGEPNGVILEGGEFIHLRPGGMARVGLGLGATVNAVGEVRTTVLGTRLLQAHRVNQIDLDGRL